MRVKRFEATTMQEALQQVKHELGPHAVILSTRQLKKGKGTFGMFGRSIVEVTAAVDHDEEEEARPSQRRGQRPPTPQLPATHPHEIADVLRSLDPLQRDVDQVKELLHQLTMRTRVAPQVNLNGLEREFSALKKMVELLVRNHQDGQSPLFTPSLVPYYQRLLASGMEEELARLLTDKVQNSIVREKLAEEPYVQSYFASMLLKITPIGGPLPLQSGQQTAIALVGPTGVGKTTTIAKLAAHYTLGEKKRVALVTIDTYRIAAVEQLRTFAKIIGLPLEVVLTETDLDRTLAQHQDKDLVLIDTAGRSQRDALQMAELQAFFGGGKRAQVYLVLSATASAANLAETVARFTPLGPTSLVFTKLDESNTFGSLLGTAYRAHLPLSYLTTGQRVPEDIEVATAERVVDLILNVSQWRHHESGWMEDTST